ncbi:MAG: esterase-like activity of phytase family protein [Chitinophagaceae bacterium]
MRLSYLIILFIAFFSSRCSSSKNISSKTNEGIRGLKFINEYVVPNAMQFQETTVGGLSGIDYDVKSDVYYMICDDPSTKGPARFYTAKILISNKGIDTVIFTGVTAVLDPGGNPYPDITKDRIHSADLEAMRYDPAGDILIRSSEGQRIIRDGRQELQNPDIVIMNRNGRYIDSFLLPANMYIQLEEKGPRHNSVFEGLTFADDDSSVYISLEDAIYDDGPSAGTGDSTAWIRLLKFDRKTKRQIAQYAYQLDAVPHAPVPPGAFKINGVSDILYAGNNKFIVIERGYSAGRLPSDIRVYSADINDAEDISGIASLATQPVQKSVTKKLLLDMNTLDVFIDNIEGVTFGPVLPNGRRSLVFVADNNFAARQKSQFLLFEILP